MTTPCRSTLSPSETDRHLLRILLHQKRATPAEWSLLLCDGFLDQSGQELIVGIETCQFIVLCKGMRTADCSFSIDHAMAKSIIATCSSKIHGAIGQKITHIAARQRGVLRPNQSSNTGHIWVGTGRSTEVSDITVSMTALLSVGAERVRSSP